VTQDVIWGILGGMEPVEFRITAEPTGYGQVVIDGQDVTEQIDGYYLQVRRGAIPTLTLELKADGAVEGVALVEAQVDGDMLDQLAKLLESTDAASLEQEALDSLELGDGPGAVTAQCLQILAGRLRERP
jgi:endonuclease V-like protein UPF0215 family